MTKGLYLHIPFCKSKCRYCSFNSFSGISFLQRDYRDAMIKGIRKLNKNKDTLDTIYIGGGTPSYMEGEYIRDIMDAVYDTFKVSEDAEITIEINPNTVDEKKLELYRASGINRVSMGVQSMVDDELKALGRIHTAEDAERSYDIIRKSGFDNISLDLMYALPNQTQKSLMESIEKITDLNPTHISCYGLSIDEGTPLFDDLRCGKITEKTDEEYLRMYEIIRNSLAKKGYMHYEISNFALDGYRARHNTSYWKCMEYYAMGAGASGYINGQRFVYTEDVKKFIENPHIYTVEETLLQKDKMSEFVMLGLRMLTEGVDKKEFEKRFDKDIYQIFEEPLNKHIATGMLEDKGDRILLAPKAYYICNNVMADFMI